MPEQGAAETRIAGLDALRVIATFGVVFSHVATYPAYSQPDASNPDWLFADYAYCFSHWPVPAFLMLMGALWARGGRGVTRAVWKRRLLRILALTFSSSLLYVLLAGFWFGNFAEQGLLVTLMGGYPFLDLWFLYLAVGLYATAPVLLRVPRGVSMILLLAVYVIALYACWPARGPVGSVFAGLAICGSFVIGIELQRWPPPKMWEAVTWAIVLTACGIAASLISAAWASQGTRGLEYVCAPGYPLMVIMGVAMFRLCSRVPAWSWLRQLARTTPLIYVLHPLAIQFLVAHQFFGWWEPYAIGVPVTSIFAFILTLIPAVIALYAVKWLLENRVLILSIRD